LFRVLREIRGKIVKNFSRRPDVVEEMRFSFVASIVVLASRRNSFYTLNTLNTLNRVYRIRVPPVQGCSLAAAER
jgi:hypothetical protein